MKYIKEYKEINFEDWDDEEGDELNTPIYIKELSSDEYTKLLSSLNKGDRFIFSIANIQGITYNNINGEILEIRDHVISIQFDEFINGNSGYSSNGNRGYCWSITKQHHYNLIIKDKL